MTEVRQTMRAVVIDRFGGPEVLRLAELPVPRPGPGEVLIAVEAAGVNPGDCKTRGGSGVPVPAFPAVLGWDVAGTVMETGVGVHAFAAGDRVFGMVAFPRLAGAYAGMAVAHANELCRIPDSVTNATAAAAPLVTLTAWQALFAAAKIQAGDKVLINGAAGGVGHVAVQLAARVGAEVTAVASTRNHSYLEALGAHRCVDYGGGPLAETVTGMDVVLDTHGGDLAIARTLRADGSYVTIATAAADLTPLAKSDVRVLPVLVHPFAEHLAAIAGLLGKGELTITLDEVFPLTEAAAAHARSEGGHVRGKVVLDVGV